MTYIKTFKIVKPDESILNEIKSKIENKTKPPGSLGRLEEVAAKVAQIQRTLNPRIVKPSLVVFAGDHGITREGVSPYPQEVTYQMVMNFVRGGAAINSFCQVNGMKLYVVDAGVNFDFSNAEEIIMAKIGYGTRNFLKEEAMTEEECNTAINYGAGIIDRLFENGCNCVGLGEMGIGNTSSASLIMSKIMKIPIDNCVGRGTGANDEHMAKKKQILKKAAAFHPDTDDALKLLRTYGGYEIAMLVGAMLQAAENRMVLIIDGFIVTSALLIAKALYKDVLNYSIFSHQSAEKPHEIALNFIGAKPLLNLGMRLGEGTGAALAYPIIATSVQFFNEMASFDEAGVSNRKS